LMTLASNRLAQKLRRTSRTAQDKMSACPSFQIARGVFECFAFRETGRLPRWITSALSQKAASSNDVRVRVLRSTKKIHQRFSRNAGTFLISRVPTCLNASTVPE
jgi:hypothetical protein